MFLHLMCSAAITASLIAANIAHPDPCQSLEIPVGFVNLNTGPTPEFSAVDLKAVFGNDTAVLKSMTLDEGPRRILLVMDRDKKLSVNTIKGEQLILETILSSVREDDQLALMSARGRRRMTPFTKDRGELLSAFASEDTSAPNGSAILDTVLDGIEMFGSAQPGDAIVVIAAGLGGNSSRRAQVLTTLLRHGIRLFGIALGPVARHYTASNQTSWQETNGRQSTSVTTSAFDIGDETFHPFTMASGGFVLVAMNPYPFQSDSIKNPGVQSRIQAQTKAILRLVTKYSRIEIEAPRSGPWRLGLSEAARKSAPGVLLLYPQELWPCTH